METTQIAEQVCYAEYCAARREYLRGELQKLWDKLSSYEKMMARSYIGNRPDVPAASVTVTRALACNDMVSLSKCEQLLEYAKMCIAKAEQVDAENIAA